MEGWKLGADYEDAGDAVDGLHELFHGLGEDGLEDCQLFLLPALVVVAGGVIAPHQMAEGGH